MEKTGEKEMSGKTLTKSAPFCIMDMTEECMICKTKGKTQNINLYVFGPEGLDICFACEMELGSHLKALSSLADRVDRR